MKRGWAVTLAWGCILGVLTAAQLPYGPSAAEVALLGGAAAANLLAALVLYVLERRRRGPAPLEAPTPIPDLSAATMVVALGLAALVVGFEVGPWLAYIGGGVGLLGLGGLVRELRAERA